MTVGTVRIGTSGWNYPSGRGTWNGVFYPPARKREKHFDELAYYAEHFDTVEVNSTFYGQPRADVTRAWADRTPGGFEFSIKLYQKFTHPGMYRKRVARALPDDAPSEDAVAALVEPNRADLDEFRRGIEPLAASGKLGAILAQFPASFKRGDREEAYLTVLLSALADYSVAVELRHRSWSDAVADTVTLLNGFHAAWVQIDEPKFRFSIRQNFLPNLQGFYYMRLHGRNGAKWWRHASSEERYDYLYSADEIDEFGSTLDAVGRIVKKAYAYTNNHFAAKSVVNAAMLKKKLGQSLGGEYPAELVDRYEALATIVAPPDANGRTAAWTLKS
jgi:uncharacterized protein YecE (DUF72 family)